MIRPPSVNHIIVTSNLLPRIVQLAYPRYDADFPDSFRNDPTRPERFPDHDAPITSGATPSPAPTATATATATPPATATATSASHCHGNSDCYCYRDGCTYRNCHGNCYTYCDSYCYGN